jgi:hypothetical protein
MQPAVRLFILLGILFLIIGGLLFVFGKLHIPLGHLPGDISIQGKHGSFYFPLTTCILVSVVLTLVVNVILRLIKK